MANEELRMKNEELKYAFFQNTINKSIAEQYKLTLITHHSSLITEESV